MDSDPASEELPEGEWSAYLEACFTGVPPDCYRPLRVTLGTAYNGSVFSAIVEVEGELCPGMAILRGRRDLREASDREVDAWILYRGGRMKLALPSDTTTLMNMVRARLRAGPASVVDQGSNAPVPLNPSPGGVPLKPSEQNFVDARDETVAKMRRALAAIFADKP